MTSFIDYEKENNAFLNTLRTPKYSALVNACISKNVCSISIVLEISYIFPLLFLAIFEITTFANS